ncbi:MAG: acyl carrier protein [Pseudolabrys sp.]|nr:acyl carrier protein [Pseudolabrys sp.]
MTPQDISQFCVDSIAAALRVPKDGVETGATFSQLGLDSAMIIDVMMMLEEKVGIELTTDDFYDHPTVDDLSHYLADKRRARSAA